MMRTRQRLLPKILAEREFALDIAPYHGEFVASLASMERRGVELKGAAGQDASQAFRQRARRLWHPSAVGIETGAAALILILSVLLLAAIWRASGLRAFEPSECCSFVANSQRSA